METDTSKKLQAEEEKLYGMVRRFREDPEGSARNKGRFNFSDPMISRALRIHRHLQALEKAILEQKGRESVSLQLQPQSSQVVISIRNPEVHCQRSAYLSLREFTLLRQNREVESVLRHCSSWDKVARCS